MKWLWKKICNLWDNIIYYLWDVPKTWYYDIKSFLINFIKFRKQLWNFRPWDFMFCNDMFAESLRQLRDCIEHGNEERRAANKKIAAINELISLLGKINNEFDIDEVYDYSMKERDFSMDEYLEEYWKRKSETIDRIARIMKGQEPKPTGMDPFHNYDEWVELFDGTDCEGWWD